MWFENTEVEDMKAEILGLQADGGGDTPEPNGGDGGNGGDTPAPTPEPNGGNSGNGGDDEEDYDQ